MLYPPKPVRNQLLPSCPLVSTTTFQNGPNTFHNKDPSSPFHFEQKMPENLTDLVESKTQTRRPQTPKSMFVVFLPREWC